MSEEVCNYTYIAKFITDIDAYTLQVQEGEEEEQLLFVKNGEFYHQPEEDYGGEDHHQHVNNEESEGEEEFVEYERPTQLYFSIPPNINEGIFLFKFLINKYYF